MQLRQPLSSPLAIWQYKYSHQYYLQDPYQSYQDLIRIPTIGDQSYFQDGAILAVCILTLVTAVILLIDFIIMARSRLIF